MELGFIPILIVVLFVIFDYFPNVFSFKTSFGMVSSFFFCRKYDIGIRGKYIIFIFKYYKEHIKKGGQELSYPPLFIKQTQSSSLGLIEFYVKH